MKFFELGPILVTLSTPSRWSRSWTWYDAEQDMIKGPLLPYWSIDTSTGYNEVGRLEYVYFRIAGLEVAVDL